MGELPLIFVVIHTYNEEAFIDETLRSTALLLTENVSIRSPSMMRREAPEVAPGFSNEFPVSEGSDFCRRMVRRCSVVKVAQLSRLPSIAREGRGLQLDSYSLDHDLSLVTRTALV